MLLSTVAFAQNAGLSNNDILAAADAHRGSTFGVTWTLNVQEQGGKSATLSVQARGDDFLATYTAPAEQKGQMILQRGLNMWFIKPGIAKPVPISPRQRLLGAASYGDIASMRWTNDYRHKRLPDQTNPPAFMFQLTGSSKAAAYDDVTLTVLKEDLEASKAVVKSTQGQAIKTVTYEYANRVPGRYASAQGKPDDASFISKSMIAEASGTTTLTYTDINFVQVEPSTFRLTQ